jgi:hypothetical protein
MSRTIAIRNFTYTTGNVSKIEYDWYKEKMVQVKAKAGEVSSMSAKAEITQHGHQDPYFSLTGTASHVGGGDSFGCLHDLISEHFPELAPYVKWHLASITQPMYYLENGLYHLETGHIDYFKSTVVWGTVESDKDHEGLLQDIEKQLKDAETIETEKVKKRMMKEQADRIKPYLIERLPALMKHFREDMEELFGDQIEWVKVEKLPYRE